MNKNRIHTENAPAAIGPYSQAIDLGEMIFTSGQIPVAPDGSVSSDISEQTRQALLNLKAVVEAGGSSFDKVIKTTVFITDMAQFGAINAVYSEFFSEPYPARSCVQVAALPKGVSIEIEAVAIK
ncbi:MAG: RidA family protein [Oscillospiraceae bacterium]|nr:RidA family protein [Oscillospiraceae bacterium]MBR6658198.1 RidA family protein [Oscillospiraceae bacterium]